MLGYGPNSTGNMKLYKLTFSFLSPDWELTLPCQSLHCDVGLSESLLVSSSIYSFFSYGNPRYLYLAVISVTDGTVVARYKSSVQCDDVQGSEINGDYILTTTYSAFYYLVVFNKAIKAFSIKSFSGNGLFSVGLDAATSR